MAENISIFKAFEHFFNCYKQTLSKTDMLTGVLNRNAMNKRIKDLSSDRSDLEYGLGIVFVDVNGLKTVNDNNGHIEGDVILKNVASKLMNVFENGTIYRAGGDEFLIIITDMDKDSFYGTFEKLKSLSRVEGEPAFALGAHYDDKNTDIKKIMQIADKNMYENKAEYYASNPHLDRRTY